MVLSSSTEMEMDPRDWERGSAEIVKTRTDISPEILYALQKFGVEDLEQCKGWSYQQDSGGPKCMVEALSVAEGHLEASIII